MHQLVRRESALLRAVRLLERLDAARSPWRFPLAVAVLSLTFWLWLPLAIGYAHVLPGLVWHWVSRVKPALPFTTDPRVLARVEDWYALNLTLVRFWRRFAIGRRAAYDELIDELDEELDSFRLVREHGNELEQVLATIHGRQSA